MLTCPDVEKVRFVPPVIEAGPEPTANETGEPAVGGRRQPHGIRRRADRQSPGR